MRRARAWLACLLVVGCGAAHDRRPAAEPALAPVAVRPAAGRSVRVGTRPEGIVADARTGLVAVAVRDPSQIVLLRAASGRIVRRVALPAAPRHLQLAGAGGSVLVAEEGANQLLELTLPGGATRSVAVGAHPHDAAAAAGRVFVANEHGASVSVIAGGRVVRRVGGFVQPGGVAAVGSEIAVVDVGADTVTLIDARTLRVLGHARAGSGPTHAVGDPGGHLYVVDTRGDAVLKFSTRPRLRLVGRTPVPGTPYGIASDPARGRLWITETATNRVLELSTRGTVPRVLASFSTGRQPNTAAVDGRDGRLFVADAAAGTVQIVDVRAGDPRSRTRRTGEEPGRFKRGGR